MATIRLYKDMELDGARLPTGFLIAVEDAAIYLGVSDETLRRYIASGRFTAQREDGSHGRFGWRWVMTTDEVNRIKRASTTTTRTVLP